MFFIDSLQDAIYEEIRPLYDTILGLVSYHFSLALPFVTYLMQYPFIQYKILLSLNGTRPMVSRGEQGVPDLTILIAIYNMVLFLFWVYMF